jgi:stress response protein YsnF
MPQYDLDTILAWRGRTVLDRDGDKIGRVGELFLDRATDLPAWAGVHTGLFGRHETFVPIQGIEEDGKDLRVPYDKATVTDAPHVDPDVALTEDEERALHEHYGEHWAPYEGGDDEDGGAVAAAADRADVADERGAGTPAGRSSEGPAEVIRSEEEPVVTDRTERRPVERVRLRKVLVTEHQQRTVPVRREEVRLETEPPPEGDDVERVDDDAKRPG